MFKKLSSMRIPSVLLKVIKYFDIKFAVGSSISCPFDYLRDKALFAC